MLTAVLLGAVLVSAAGAGASSGPGPIYALQQGPLRQGAPELSLLRLDPETLSETGRIVLGEGYVGSSVPRAFAPGRARLAVAQDAQVRIVDLAGQRLLHEIPLGSDVVRLTWPASGDLLALRRGAFVRIDPVEGKVLREWAAPDWVSASLGAQGRVVAITGPRQMEGRGLLGGQPIRVRFLEQERSPRSVRVDKVRIALELWHVRKGAVLPRFAEDGVSQARSDLSSRRGISPDRIETVSITPFPTSCRPCFPYQGHYEIVLGAEGRYYLYTAAPDEVWGSIYTAFRSELPARPASTETDILHAPLGTWEVPSVGLALRRNRAYVVTPGSMIVEVDLESRRIRYHRLSRALGGVSSPLFLGPLSLAVASATDVKLVDLRTGKVRSLRTGTYPRIDPADDGFVVFNPSSGGTSLTAYDRRGRARYAVGLGALVDRVQIADRLAYVRLTNPLTGVPSVAVLDLDHEGRELHREEVPRPIELLVGRG